MNLNELTVLIEDNYTIKLVSRRFCEIYFTERSRGFRRNPICENKGQHREEIIFNFFVETTNRPY